VGCYTAPFRENMAFIRIAGVSELPEPGRAAEFHVNQRMICVANLNGEYAALDNVCLHRGGPLGQGVVEGEKIICPWHGWEFHARTGEVAHGDPVKLKTYAIRIEGDDVLMEL
jgi:nitrite reductase (NADH) small subunit